MYEEIEKEIESLNASIKKLTQCWNEQIKQKESASPVSVIMNRSTNGYSPYLRRFEHTP